MARLVNQHVESARQGGMSDGLAEFLRLLIENPQPLVLAGVLLLATAALLLTHAARRREKRRHDRLRAEIGAASQLLVAELAELKGRLGAMADTVERRHGDLEARVDGTLRESLRSQLEREERINGLLNARLGEVSDRLWQSLERAGDRMGGGLEEVSGRLGERLQQSSRRTDEVLSALAARLEAIDGTKDALSALSGEVRTLNVVLADKQARGAYGQGRLEAIVSDQLPASSYAFQATLSNGSRPDALLDIGGGTGRLAIDAKFPLEAFEALRNATTDGERRAAEADIRAHVGRHIDDIARKYLIPGETRDMALLFIPAESLYAELHERFPDVIQKALRARVVIVSPSMLMLAVETMRALIKDVRLNDEAAAIRREVALVVDDVKRLAERAKELERHFALATRDLERLGQMADRIGARGARIERLDVGKEVAAPPHMAGVEATGT
jgi:DNA recombination protein RmuC